MPPRMSKSGSVSTFQPVVEKVDVATLFVKESAKLMNKDYQEAVKFRPEGDPDKGIKKEILAIELAKQSKRWDDMVERLNHHLKKTVIPRAELNVAKRKALLK